MSFKAALVKLAIKLTPNIIVIWVANIILRGIAVLSEFFFDLDSRTAYVELTLVGEAEPIQVEVDGFAVVNDGDSYRVIIQNAQANRPWLNNLLARVVGKAWEIPQIPQHQAQIELIAELLEGESQEKLMN
ncbi:hypothetical protein Q9L42_018850 [Methylomarinum sp. Ch1-1]|uniref:Uncharacterized protein n=1 Tax=Methylomarinum roseum TaxID=3067653 RepID=A0AAU7NTR9_9GAMM|nr:hypothetical protein [Methylomarinum sp. Ch1-1]MDP4519555.1 hypothetical protein [Methylomarinum sp. Ch1-1]